MMMLKPCQPLFNPVSFSALQIISLNGVRPIRRGPFLQVNCLCSASFVDDETEPGVGRAEDPLRQGCEDCTGKRPKSGGFEEGEKLH